MRKTPPTADAEPTGDPKRAAKRPGLLRRIGRALRNWLGMYEGCGCRPGRAADRAARDEEQPRR